MGFSAALSLAEEKRNEHDSCIGDLFPYFSCEVEFAQDRIRRDWPACVDRTYGTEELKRMIAAYQGRASDFLR